MPQNLGLLLFSNSVLPSLFPFFIATNLLSYTNVVSFMGNFLNKIMRPIFNVPGEGSFALLMGIISGYPMGSKIASDFKSKGIVTDIECERLISFTNNSGPLFIIGTVGSSLFYDTRIGLLLFFTHVLSCLSVGFIFRWWKSSSKYNSVKYNKNNTNLSSSNNYINSKTASFSNLGEILSVSILNSINTIVLIGGFVVLFSVVVSILENSKILFILSRLFCVFLNSLNIPSSFSTGILTRFY